MRIFNRSIEENEEGNFNSFFFLQDYFDWNQKRQSKKERKKKIRGGAVAAGPDPLSGPR